MTVPWIKGLILVSAGLVPLVAGAQSNDTLDVPSLTLPGNTPAITSTNAGAPAPELDPSLLAVPTPRGGAEPVLPAEPFSAPSTLRTVTIPGQSARPSDLSSVPTPAPAPSSPTAASPAAPPPKPGEPLLHIDPPKPRKRVAEDDSDTLTLDLPTATDRGSGSTAATAAPERGGFLDRIISSRTRSYALTNVTANSTNSIFRPLYDNQPDLRDYHPTDRPEHIPAQENSNREQVQ